MNEEGTRGSQILKTVLKSMDSTVPEASWSLFLKLV